MYGVARVMIETYRETLEQMGVSPTGTDPVAGEPSFGQQGIARALGVPRSDLDSAVSNVVEENTGESH